MTKIAVEKVNGHSCDDTLGWARRHVRTQVGLADHREVVLGLVRLVVELNAAGDRIHRVVTRTLNDEDGCRGRREVRAVKPREFRSRQDDGGLYSRIATARIAKGRETHVATVRLTNHRDLVGVDESGECAVRSSAVAYE